MSRKLIAGLALSLGLFGLMGMGGNKEEVKPPLQYGVIEAAVIFQESVPGKAGMARLEKIQTEAIAKLEGLQKDVEAAEKEGDAAKKDRVTMELQALLYQMQSELQADQEKVVAAINAALTKTLTEYQAANGLMGIMASDNMLSYAPEANITRAVMTQFDKVTVDFGPMPVFELPAAPEAPKADAAAAPEVKTDAAAPKADAAAPEVKAETAAPKADAAAEVKTETAAPKAETAAPEAPKADAAAQ